METTVGRVLFNNILPKELPYMNKVMNRKSLVKLTSQMIHTFPREIVVEVLAI